MLISRSSYYCISITLTVHDLLTAQPNPGNPQASEFFCVIISIAVSMRASWTSKRWANTSPPAEVDLNQIWMLLKLRLINNLITSFMLSSPVAAFQLTYTKSHPSCVEPTFVKTAFCLVVLRKSLAPKSRYCRKHQKVQQQLCAVVDV